MSARAYWIVGPGRLGLSIGSLLAETGAATELTLVGRSAEPPAHPVIDLSISRYVSAVREPPSVKTTLIIAVPDDRIADVASTLAGLGRPPARCTALHTSGARTAGDLAVLRAVGYAVGSLHPLQTIADAADGPSLLRGAVFTFEGDEAARLPAGAVVSAAGGELWEIAPGAKSGYHAAGVFASNHVVACMAVAARLLANAAGVPAARAHAALLPLLRGTVKNLTDLGMPGALTGPVARGDVDTVRAHLGGLDRSERELYRRLALEALMLARDRGLSEDRAIAIERELAGGDGRSA